MVSALSDGELYPGRDLSISQLLYAAKKKLRGITLGGRYVQIVLILLAPFKRKPYRTVTPLEQAEVRNLWTDESVCGGGTHMGLCFQIAALERDTSKVLAMLRSMLNAFAPINRIPPDVLSLIPDYWERLCYQDWRDTDRDVVSLTHVCHGWREIFTSRSSLWTRLDCKELNKTHAYIRRSRPLPLEVSVVRSNRGLRSATPWNHTSYSNDAFLALAPHTNRFASLVIYVLSRVLPDDLLGHFTFPAPLLKELRIVLSRDTPGYNVNIPSTIFAEHLSPLRNLSLSGVATHLPWRNLSNLTTFRFRHPPNPMHPLFMTQLLDFFESTPLIRKIVLCNSIPDSSTVLPGRVVPLINLKNLTVDPLPVHSPFLNHLSIPTGASLDLELCEPLNGSWIPVFLTNAFHNLRHITTISLLLDRLEWTSMRIGGPSGELRTAGYLEISQVFHFLSKFDLSKTRILSISVIPFTTFEGLENSTFFQFLLPMRNLHTLTLIEVNNLPFIQALNPKQNESCALLCPELKELVLYIRRPDWYYVEELKEMVRERNLRLSSLSSITIISPDEVYARMEVLSRRDCISRVEYKLEESPPDWEEVFGGRGEGDDDRNWDFSPDDSDKVFEVESLAG